MLLFRLIVVFFCRDLATASPHLRFQFGVILRRPLEISDGPRDADFGPMLFEIN